MINILLLSAGTNACYHIARVLKEKFPQQFKIVGTDINEKHLIPTAAFLDVFYKGPRIKEEGYYEYILNVCKKENINFLIPSFDDDQKLFYPENKDLVNLNVQSLGVSKQTLPIYDDKLQMNMFLEKNGFPVPKHYEAKDCLPDNMYMVKPIHGVGSVGAGAKKGSDILNLDTNGNIIQELCSEPEVTMECFCYETLFSCVCRQRIATKSGVCTKGRIFIDEDLREIGKKFAQKIKVPYIFNLQFMKNTKGAYVITDVNLRSAGGMSMAYTAGWDEVSALAKIMLKRPLAEIESTLPNKIPETFIVRAYTDIVTRRDYNR